MLALAAVLSVLAVFTMVAVKADSSFCNLFETGSSVAVRIATLATFEISNALNTNRDSHQRQYPLSQQSVQRMQSLLHTPGRFPQSLHSYMRPCTKGALFRQAALLSACLTAIKRAAFETSTVTAVLTLSGKIA